MIMTIKPAVYEWRAGTGAPLTGQTDIPIVAEARQELRWCAERAVFGEHHGLKKGRSVLPLHTVFAKQRPANITRLELLY